MKRLFYDVAAENPISLFQPGRVLDKFPGYRIYVESRTDEGVLKNLQIIEVEGTKPKTFIRAKSAVLETVPGQLDFNLILKDANIEQAREDAEGNVSAVDSVRFGQTAMNFPLSQLKERTERVNASMKPPRNSGGRSTPIPMPTQSLG
jgi:lipopolysaccharide export system permease protein